MSLEYRVAPSDGPILAYSLTFKHFLCFKTIFPFGDLLDVERTLRMTPWTARLDVQAMVAIRRYEERTIHL